MISKSRNIILQKFRMSHIYHFDYSYRLGFWRNGNARDRTSDASDALPTARTSETAPRFHCATTAACSNQQCSPSARLACSRVAPLPVAAPAPARLRTWPVALRPFLAAARPQLRWPGHHPKRRRALRGQPRARTAAGAPRGGTRGRRPAQCV